MTYACWLKDSNVRETDGTIEPHEALQIALLLPDGETEIYIEGTPEPGRFRSFLSRFGFEFAANLPAFVNLTNGSGWVLPTR